MNTFERRPALLGLARVLVAAAGTGLLLLDVFVALPVAQDIESLKSAIVRVIKTTSQGQRETGTGFVVRQEPAAIHIVTAAHVLENAAKVEVEFYSRRNRPVTARVVQLEGADPRGIGLLLCETRVAGVTVLPLRDATSVQGGESVITIGFPVVSNVPWAVITGSLIGRSGRTLTFSGAIDGGNSGGPLIRDGSAIGIVTEVTGQTGYAVPALIAQYALEGWGVTIGRPVGGPSTSKGGATAPESLANTQISFVSDRSGSQQIYGMNADGSNLRQLTRDGGWVHAWSPDGNRIAYIVRGALHVMNADGSNSQRLRATVGDSGLAWSPDGSQLVFIALDKAQPQGISVMNADGTNQRLLTATGGIEPSWSPDGTRIVYGWGNKTYDLFVINADGTGERNLTRSRAIHYGAAWSPDGTRIAFESNRDGSFDLYVINGDGTNPRRLTDGGQPSWSPDGTKIAFIKKPTQSAQPDIYVMNADGSNVVNITNSPAYDVHPSWSPFLRR